ncbi:M23 family metallopeptidase [Deinococcus planocerae]|uniref:M23 family metallopeptidase n=1 Tax=Deinococcus planocerae TaxID=1737569 RepID=UPI0015E132C6|nr:M23 family metallopeptidase [Deinococcus planocerae]
MSHNASTPSHSPALRAALPVALTAALTGLALLSLAACAPRAMSPTTQTAPTSHPTAIIVASTNDPLRVPGSDGLEHLEYDLLFTNVFTAPVTLTSVEVLDGPGGRSLLKLEGPALGAVTRQGTGLSNALPAGQAAPGEAMNPIPERSTASAILGVVVPRGQVPARLTHRITYSFPPDARGTSAIGSLTVDGPDLTVQRRAAVVIAPPLRGPGWFNLVGCCAASALHRYLQLVEGGHRYLKPESFAIDWVLMKDGGLFSGDGSKNEQWYGFGAEVVAAADGTVVYTRNDMPETDIGDRSPASVKAPKDYIGNSVVVQMRQGVWATYAHLQTGSVTVKVGDRVRTGQPLGKLGSSGNSTAPHLHFQLGDGPDNTTANSVPFVIDRYTLVGTVDPAAVAAQEGGDAPPRFTVIGPARPGDGTLPLFFTVADFR